MVKATKIVVSVEKAFFFILLFVFVSLLLLSPPGIRTRTEKLIE